MDKQTKEEKKISEREIALLRSLHQSAQMGRDTLEHVNGNIAPGSLRDAVEKDIFEYSDVCAQITEKLEERGEKPKAVGAIPRKMACMMIDIKVSEDTPDSEIAKMIIDGTTKGVTENTAELAEYADVCDDIKNIGYKLLFVEQKNIDEMKHFLRS